MQIQTFGATEGKLENCDVVKVGVKTISVGKDVKLTLLAVPLICDVVTNQPISTCKERYNHLIPLELADYTDSQDHLEIDVLIGADYYFTFMTGRMVKGKIGPTAVETKLGWVLLGLVPLQTQHRFDGHHPCFKI